jgi:hypothetical protein
MKSRIAPLLALTFAVAPALATAHDNIVVHRRLGELSVQQLGNPFITPYSAEIREGSYGEDVPATRSLGHFYNPQTDSAPWFAVGSGPAWQNSQTQFDAAISEYLNGNYTGEDAAFYRMGRALHFIQDMTSPAHTHDDQHGTDAEDFEDYGPAHINNYDFSNVVPKFAAVPTAEGYVKEIARVTYDMTRYPVILDAFDGCPSQCQQNSLLRTMFPSLHYEDGGFFDGDVWEIDRVGLTDTFLGASDDWWITEETKVSDSGGRGGSDRIRGDGYIENTGGNSGEPVPLVFNNQPNSANETLLQLYSHHLYPEAIAYGAGLLQVFANSVGAPPPPTSTPSTTMTSTPTATPGPQDTATHTPNGPPPSTPTLTPTPVIPLCATAPRNDCRRPPAGKSTFILKDRPGVFNDRMAWKWTQGDATAVEFGSPLTGTSYALCVYDGDGTNEKLAISAEARPGDTCLEGPCWRSLVSALRYSDRRATNDGLQLMVLRGGAPGKGRITVKARGVYLAMPTPASPTALLRQAPRVRVQFVTTGSVCWEALYGPGAIRSTVDQFKDRSD